MDGNGRWATSRGLSRRIGHIQGYEALRRAVTLCGDLGMFNEHSTFLVSRWYVARNGVASALDYTGSCASYASDPQKAAYHSVAGWPQYQCADLPDGKSSMWFALGQGVRTAVMYSGSCASWAR